MANLKSKRLGGIFRGLFVGVTGVGKTVAAGSFPGPMMVYDFDDRVEPLRQFYPNRDDIEYKTVVSGKVRHRRDAINFKDWCQEFEDLQDRCDYETIIIDSFTSLSNCSIQYQMGINTDPKLSKGGIEIPFMDEYKGETQVASQILEVMKNLECHVIFTAHPVNKLMLTKPGEMESMRSYRSITAHGTKTPSFVPNYFNEMHYFYTKDVSQMGQKPSRMVCTIQTGDILAKTALPLPPVFEVTDKPYYGVIQAFLKEHNLKLETKRQEKAAKEAAVTAI
jgi:hypothetical protein